MGRKGDETRKKIIESATRCLLQFGDRKTTFQTIADDSGYSEALVVRYLKNRENIFVVVLEHWISWAREQTERALKDAGTAEDRIRQYLRVSLRLMNRHEFARVYLLLHYFAGVEERYRVINAEIKRVAIERIASMIDKGIADGDFREIDSTLFAKSIHNDLVGQALSLATETPQPYHLKLPSLLEEHALDRLRKVSSLQSTKA